jgi:hypothetical protein
MTLLYRGDQRTLVRTSNDHDVRTRQISNESASMIRVRLIAEVQVKNTRSPLMDP